MSQTERPLNVWLICTGIGIMNRGIESFFRECFDGLHTLAAGHNVQLKLLKGGGENEEDETRVWCLPRTGLAAKWLGACMRRNTYITEQVSAVPSIAWRIHRGRPDVIFYSDVNMAMRLQKLRRRIGVPFRLVYSNGAPLPPPYTHTDHVQQLAPFYMEKALAAGEPPGKHTMLPYGIHVPEGDPTLDLAERAELRRQLALPLDRPIVLSVGWISQVHKRMGYTVEELAALPQPRPFLVMLGAIDEQTPPVLRLAEQKLGPGHFAARSVPYEQVADYYRAADVFVLSSLQEGFGRVYLESLMHGLPTLAHDHPVMRFVLGEEGTFGDLAVSGSLTSMLRDALSRPLRIEDMARRRQSVRTRYAWESLAGQYFQMFRSAAQAPIQGS